MRRRRSHPRNEPVPIPHLKPDAAVDSFGCADRFVVVASVQPLGANDLAGPIEAVDAVRLHERDTP